MKQVKILAKKNNAILIFDEITSGFKDNYGGIHLKLNVNPDIAIFGKSIGNGYPISAIIGKKKIMEVAQDTFISSTMWTDRLGFIAANTTLKLMKKLKINDLISNYGNHYMVYVGSRSFIFYLLQFHFLLVRKAKKVPVYIDSKAYPLILNFSLSFLIYLVAVWRVSVLLKVVYNKLLRNVRFV